MYQGMMARALTPKTEAEPASEAAPPTSAAPLDPIFGDLQYLDEMLRTHVKGNLVRARSRYLKEKYGDAVFMDVADSVPSEARSYLFEPPLVSSWVLAGPMCEIDRAIVAGPMKGDVTRMFEFGENIAAYDLPNVYRSVLTMLSRPSFLMGRMGMIYGMYFKEGDMHAETMTASAFRRARSSIYPGLWTKQAEPTTRGATVTLKGHVLPFYMCCYGVSGWFSAALATYGVKDKGIKHVACRHRGDSKCRWAITWTER
jgi:hypothetical protein